MLWQALTIVSHMESFGTYVNLFNHPEENIFLWTTPPPSSSSPKDHILPFSPPAGEVSLADIAVWNPYVYYRPYLPGAKKMLPERDFIPFSPALLPPAIISDCRFSVFPAITPRKLTRRKHEPSLKRTGRWKHLNLKWKVYYLENVWTKLELAGPFLSAYSL